MASGDILANFPVSDGIPSGAPASWGHRGPGSGGGEHPLGNVDDSTNEGWFFDDVLMQNYDGGGITAEIHWGSFGGNIGVVRWAIAFERIGNEQQDIDSDSFATAKFVNDDVPTPTPGMLKATEIAFLNNEIDGLLVGEAYRLHLYRNGAHVDDDESGDSQFHHLVLRET